MRSWNPRKRLMRRSKRWFSLLTLILLALAVCLNGSTTVAQAPGDGPITVMTVDAGGIEWQPQVENDGLILTVSGSDGLVYRQEFVSGTIPTFEPVDSEGQPYPDGSYTYELRVVPVVDAETRAALMAAREAGDAEAVMAQLQQAGELPQYVQVESGHFTIRDGAIVLSDAPERPALASLPGLPSTQDVLHYDDVIITGSLCVGFDCADGESFGFDTIILKEHNLRIYFNDTSYTASYPTNNWRITVNDSTNGGASYFSIDDVDDGTSIFKIEAGAPSNSLYVEDYGRVGLGTSTPVVEMHIKDSDTPTVRLEQDSSGGWTAQTFDVGSNESNFFIRDATNGSKLPFRIQPSAPSSSLCLKADGHVGIGTWSPAYPMELETTNEDAAFVADRTDGAKAMLSAGGTTVQLGSVSNHDLRFVANNTTRMTVDSGGNVGIGTTSPSGKLQVENGNISLNTSSDHGPQVVFKNSGMQWNMGIPGSAGSTDFFVYDYGSGTTRLLIESSTGRVGIGTTSPGYKLHVNGSAGKPGGGSWSDSSDARLKENVNHIDGREALDLLNQLQGVTFEWVNPEQHSAGTRAGLLAQELEEVFPDWVEEYEVQGSDKELIPEGEKAKAVHFPHDFNAYVIEAIKTLDAENQALSATVQEQDATIAALQQQNSDLEARLTALERAAGTTNNPTYNLSLGGLFLGSLLVVGIVANRQRKQ
jgi:hypothetical protein